jgi:hypothetical protein
MKGRGRFLSWTALVAVAATSALAQVMPAARPARDTHIPVADKPDF